MSLYEHIIIARQDISAQQAETLTQTFQTIITENGGKIAKTEYWGLRALAYKIKKNRKAHYTLVNIDAPHEAVHEMERQMRLSSDILRFMTIRVDEHEEGPSAMMRKSERDDRRGGRPGGGGGRDRGSFRGGGGDRDREKRPATPRPAEGASS